VTTSTTTPERPALVLLDANINILCTANLKDFPAQAVAPLGIEAISPDQLFSRLATRKT
jgi:hypothetical protein